MKSRRFTRGSEGFTMPEILVAFTLFMIVISVTSGIFVASLHSERSSFAFLNAEDNIRFALEAMAREMRTGTNFQIMRGSNPLTSGLGIGENGDTFAFVNQQGENVQYRLNQGQLEKSIDGGLSYQPLTAGTVTVETFHFNLIGAAQHSGQQPRVTLSVKVKSQVGISQTEMTVQTTVTQRQIGS